MLSSKMYFRRRDIFFTYLHWAVLKDLVQSVEELWFHHKPQYWTTCGNATVMYHMSIITDCCVLNNKHDMLIWH